MATVPGRLEIAGRAMGGRRVFSRKMTLGLGGSGQRGSIILPCDKWCLVGRKEGFLPHFKSGLGESTFIRLEGCGRIPVYIEGLYVNGFNTLWK